MANAIAILVPDDGGAQCSLPHSNVADAVIVTLTSPLGLNAVVGRRKLLQSGVPWPVSTQFNSHDSYTAVDLNVTYSVRLVAETRAWPSVWRTMPPPSSMEKSRLDDAYCLSHRCAHRPLHVPPAAFLVCMSSHAYLV